MRQKQRRCAIRGCRRPHEARNWCKLHYARWLRYSDPLAGYRPKGAAQAWILAHADHVGDKCLIWPFGQSEKGYPSGVTLDGRREAAHRAMCRGGRMAIPRRPSIRRPIPAATAAVAAFIPSICIGRPTPNAAPPTPPASFGSVSLQVLRRW
jgi:hypothetical protein